MELLLTIILIAELFITAYATIDLLFEGIKEAFETFITLNVYFIVFGVLFIVVSFLIISIFGIFI
jgi:hypothetical protein